ncbi:methyltransferase domain-containing protein [Janthinobacterium sp. 17J80-10]|uniref:methyltransferase domain-containing protein n=1 Tax=Janthinobacterium sp. 17J80-10 TaxID=2497863 RepID=UPI0010052F73|nr:methyltransferase domain-containing protein [Janthinobacterium sp. 17J80-10]QAU33358.1 methyltransferase domain-containing protein [Janthinobacterium sp. 17J80-10]
MAPPISPDQSRHSSAPIDPACVRRAFARPQRLQDSQFLRREVAQRMHERLQLVRLAPHAVLDAGCGEGADLPVLQDSFPQARLLGLDAAPAMLALAQERQRAAMSSVNRLLSKWLPQTVLPGAQGSPLLLAGDFAQLPLAANAVDLVWSNLAVHWHPQPDRVFAEWRRVLRTDGLLMFSCFGPDTFKELRNAFAVMDSAPHSLPFVDMHDFGDMLVQAGFATPVMDMESITVTYDTPEKLLADARAWGGNPLANRRRSLCGRQEWGRMLAAMEQLRRADGKLGLSFEVIYGHAFRPAPRTTASGEAIIRFELPKK